MTMTRRNLLLASAGSAALAMFARPAVAALPRDADVVVIGAGAAGIAAARRVMAANRKVIVVEAGSAIGGRCLTETSTFGAPFDRGAHWLHAPDTNALIKMVRGAGLDLSPTPPGQRLRVGRRNARAGETEDLLTSLVRANRAIDDAARGKVDVSCAAALPKDLGPWTATIEFLLGPYAAGKDLRDLSALDLSRAQDRNSAVACRQGLGTLMAKLADGIPIALSTPATRIAWSGRDIGVETPAGRIAARAVIVTVSTNVLNAGAIKFAPEVPKRQLDAASRLGLGSYDHIALQLAGNPLGLSREEMLIEQSSDARTALLAANIDGSSLCTVDVGGSFGRDLSAQGEAAMVEFATEWLVKLFGSDVSAAVKKSAATQWNAAPFVQGAMSAASPGGQPARRVLAEPLGPLFFAGEATHETLWGTVDGAWDSGERAAEAALKRIGALKSDEPAPPPRQPKKQQRQRPPPRDASAGWPGSR